MVGDSEKHVWLEKKRGGYVYAHEDLLESLTEFWIGSPGGAA